MVEYKSINWLALVALSTLMFFLESLPALSKPTSHQTTTTAAQSDKLKGAVLFKKNCQNCHSNGVTGGCLGPILAGEGARRSRAFIESRISSDREKVDEFARLYGHAELMPHLRVAPADAKVLAAYVASLSAPISGFDVRGHAAAKKARPAAGDSSTATAQQTAQAIAAGRRLVYDRGCLMCHSFGGVGGQFAPSYDGIGSRRSEEYISERISNAELLLGSSDREYGPKGLVMPPSSLTDTDIANIAKYLFSLK